MHLRKIIWAVALTLGLLQLTGCGSKPDMDEAVLVQLKKAGSDMAKLHQIDFYLYFPTQAAAEQAAASVRAQGFTAEVRPAAKGPEWLCLANKTMLPQLSALQQISRDFAKLTASAGGNYDGWETKVEK